MNDSAKTTSVGEHLLVVSRHDDMDPRRTSHVRRQKLKDQRSVCSYSRVPTKNDRAFLVVMVQKDLADMGVDAREMVKKPAQILGGSGGGRKHLAQSGGKNVTSMDKALQVAAAEAVRNFGEIFRNNFHFL